MSKNINQQTAANSYATDGKCHNAEPGTYGVDGQPELTHLAG